MTRRREVRKFPPANDRPSASPALTGGSAMAEPTGPGEALRIRSRASSAVSPLRSRHQIGTCLCYLFPLASRGAGTEDFVTLLRTPSHILPNTWSRWQSVKLWDNRQSPTTTQRVLPNTWGQ